MTETGAATDHLPARLSLTSLREAARGCRACPLWRTGTQTVFGEGRRAARLFLDAVKHFKWEPRCKSRIHQKPNAAEIAACRPWLEAELAVVQPRVLVCLGATAAQALLGRGVRVTKDRGRPLETRSRRLRSRRCIRPRSCALRIPLRARASGSSSSATSGSPRRHCLRRGSG